MKFTWNKQEYELILLTLTGSRLYGTENENSDWDYRGIFIANPDTKIGLLNSVDQIEGFGLDKELSGVLGIDIVSDDLVLFEIRKFIKLAADNNPNILDVLMNEIDKNTIVDNLL